MRWEAAIFDLDGLLVDSEPLWWRAEIASFGEVGLALTAEDCQQTTGLRIEEVVSQRWRERPWEGASQAEVTARIVVRMQEAMATEAPAKPGVRTAIETCRAAGLRLAVASSSPSVLIESALRAIGVRDAFEVVVSAENEPLAKPHPGVYLRTAELLGVHATRCFALEDSVNGMIAAKAARMGCIVVPERPDRGFALADLVLDSLEQLDANALARL